MWFEFFEGNTRDFAVKLSLLDDPFPFEGDSKAMASSWGKLQIFANGRALCDGWDQRLEQKFTATWYLLPLVFWFIDSWDALLHEQRLPLREQSRVPGAAAELARARPGGVRESELQLASAYWSRHALPAARHGGLLPNLVFRRRGGDMEISWFEDGRPGSDSVRFFETAGRHRTSVETFDAVLRNALDAVLTAVSRRADDDDEVADYRRRLADLENPSTTRMKERAAWLAGLANTVDETLGLWKGQEARGFSMPLGRSCGAYTEPEPAHMLFSSLPRRQSEAGIGACRAVLNHVQQLPSRTLKLCRSSASQRDRTPYQAGYDLALDTREALDLEDTIQVDMERLLESLGIPVVDLDLEGTSVKGISVCIGGSAAIGVARSRRPRHRRITLAHELCHVLYDRNHPDGTAHVSGRWADRAVEQRANAFAAMFLMPEDLLEVFVEESHEPPEARVWAVASQFGVSMTAAAHHLFNLELLSDADYHRVRDLLRSSRSVTLGDDATDRSPTSGSLPRLGSASQGRMNNKRAS